MKRISRTAHRRSRRRVTRHHNAETTIALFGGLCTALALGTIVALCLHQITLMHFS